MLQASVCSEVCGSLAPLILGARKQREDRAACEQPESQTFAFAIGDQLFWDNQQGAKKAMHYLAHVGTLSRVAIIECDPNAG